MKILISLLLGLATVFNPAWADKVDTPYGEVTIPMPLHKVPGAPVYYVIGQSGVPSAENEGFTSNAGFVVTDKGVVVYDALGTPALGYRLLLHIRSVTDKPVRIVVAGHYHADHIYGLQAFKEHTRATIWAQRDSAIYLDSRTATARLAQRREALFPWVDEKTYVVKPDKTFDREHVFDMGDTRLKLVHAGPAHSPDDTIMTVQGHGVVFSGDLIYGGRLPFLAGEEVDTRKWLKGLDYLQNIRPRPRFVIPGHGQADANPAAAIAFTRDYIQFLRDKMGQAVENMVDFDTAYAATDWSRYEKVPTFKAANRMNAYKVYLDMENELLQ